jgi:hypothetical protein
LARGDPIWTRLLAGIDDPTEREATPRGTDRLNHHIEESRGNVVHHVRGLDLYSGCEAPIFGTSSIHYETGIILG